MLRGGPFSPPPPCEFLVGPSLLVFLRIFFFLEGWSPPLVRLRMSYIPAGMRGEVKMLTMLFFWACSLVEFG